MAKWLSKLETFENRAIALVSGMVSGTGITVGHDGTVTDFGDFMGYETTWAHEKSGFGGKLYVNRSETVDSETWTYRAVPELDAEYADFTIDGKKVNMVKCLTRHGCFDYSGAASEDVDFKRLSDCLSSARKDLDELREISAMSFDGLTKERVAAALIAFIHGAERVSIMRGREADAAATLWSRHESRLSRVDMDTLRRVASAYGRDCATLRDLMRIAQDVTISVSPESDSKASLRFVTENRKLRVLVTRLFSFESEDECAMVDGTLAMYDGESSPNTLTKADVALFNAFLTGDLFNSFYGDDEPY